MTAAPAKICALCNQDCSERPRVKDNRGRYICKPCEDRRAGGPASMPHAIQPATQPADDFIALEPDEPGPAEAERTISVCPACGSALGPGAAVCIRCGYDKRAGLTPSAVDADGAPIRKCAGCGYNLAGLKSPKCPECGRATIARRGRAERGPAPTGWVVPVVLIAVSLVLTALLQFLIDRSGEAFLRSLLGLGLKIPLAVIAYAAAGLLWMGFDMPWKHVFLRYTAVCAIGTLIGVPIGFIPFIFAQAGIMIFVYALLISNLLEVDIQDSIFIASFTVVANLIIVLAVLNAAL